MAPRHDDDLFQQTSMTFGEHLEELRGSLFKSVLCLAVGVGIGLLFANRIVQWIQTPLENALENFYKVEAEEYFNAHVPPEMRDSVEAKTLVHDEGLEPQEFFISPDEIVRELRQQFPRQYGELPLPGQKSATPAKDAPAQEAPAQAEPPNGAPAKAPNAEATAATAAAPTATANATANATAHAPANTPAARAAGPNARALPKRENMIRVMLWRRIAEDERMKVKNFNVQESFMIWIKAGFLAGAIISAPGVFYFLWSFVAAGLYPQEKHYVHLFLPVSLGLFMCGALLAFFFVFPPVLNFFFSITKAMGQGIEPRISEWLSFVLLMPLGFGISFQLPLIMLFLERIRIFSVQVYISKWRVAVLLMAIAAMILSPGGDPNSMVMMLVPLIGLYFAGIALCKWLPNKRAQSGDSMPGGN